MSNWIWVAAEVVCLALGYWMGHKDGRAAGVADRIHHEWERGWDGRRRSIDVDHEAKCAYIRMSHDEVFETIQICDGVLIDLDGQSRPVGVEFLTLAPEMLARYAIEVEGK